MSERKAENPWVKLAIDIGPLAVFFIAYGRFGLFGATGAFMAATALALGVSWIRVRKLPMVPLVTGAVVFVFGGLTLILQDETFIKMKPTIINSLFAIILLGGLASGRILIKPLLGTVVEMSDQGWRGMTLRWGGFFITMAVLNEFVWRNFSTDAWVNFKVFGFLPITLVFALSQVPYMNRHSVTVEDSANPDQEPTES